MCLDVVDSIVVSGSGQPRSSNGCGHWREGGVAPSIPANW